MGRYRRLRITTARREIFAIRGNDLSTSGRFCPACSAHVTWIDLAAGAALSALSVREIFRLVERGNIHFREVEGGRSLLCRDSLVKFMIEKER